MSARRTRLQRTRSSSSSLRNVAVVSASDTRLASCVDTIRVLSTTLASRLAVPRQSTDDALVRIAGATRIDKAANGLLPKDGRSITRFRLDRMAAYDSN